MNSRVVSSRVALFFWLNAIQFSRPWYWWSLRRWRYLAFQFLKAVKGIVLSPQDKQTIEDLEVALWGHSLAEDRGPFGIGYWLVPANSDKGVGT